MKNKSEKSESMQIALRYYKERIRKYPKYVLGVLLIVPFTSLFGRYLPPLVLANVINQPHLPVVWRSQVAFW